MRGFGDTGVDEAEGLRVLPGLAFGARVEVLLDEPWEDMIG